MTSFWLAIGDLFQAIAPCIKAIGRGGNFMFFFIGFIANAMWIAYMIKNPEDKGKYHTRY
jgi:hypothetical protein